MKVQLNRDRNTWTPVEFATHDIGSPHHPEHPEFLAVLADPALTGSRVHFWGMAAALSAARACERLVAKPIRR